MGKRVALKRSESRLLTNPTFRDSKSLSKFFCSEQLKLFPGTFATRLFPRHFRPSKMNHFQRLAVAHRYADPLSSFSRALWYHAVPLPHVWQVIAPSFSRCRA